MKKFAGITSMLLLLINTALAFSMIGQSNIFHAIIYLVLMSGSALVIIYAFCAKCPSKKECVHILPGFIAHLFRNRPVSRYTKTELWISILIMLVWLIYPQFWLVHHIKIACIFWVFAFASVMFILKGICPNCKNAYCPFHSKLK